MPAVSMLSIRSKVPGSTHAEVSDLEGRRVVLVESEPDRHLGALRSTDGARIEAAAEGTEEVKEKAARAA